MTFTIYFKNGQKTTIDAKTISKARQEAEKISAVDKCYANTDTVEGLQSAVLTVVKRTTAKMISNESTPDQHRLYKAAKCKPVTDPDVLDMISEATIALWEAIQEGKDIVEQHKAAYKAVNKYLYHERRIDTAKTAARHVYIESITGDIVNVNKEAAKILNVGEPYNPIPVLCENPTVQAEKATVIRNIIKGISDEQIAVLKKTTDGVTPRQIAALKVSITEGQRKVLFYTAEGESLRKISKRVAIKAGSIAKLLKKIRERGNKMYPDIAEKYKRWNKTTVDNSKDSDLTFKDFEKLMQNDF